MYRVKNIFLCDSNLSTRFLLKSILNEIVPDLVIIESEHILELLLQLDPPMPEPELIIFNTAMGCFNGQDFIHHMKYKQRFDKLPILAYSNQNDIQERAFIYLAGASYYLKIPKSYNNIRKMIKEIFTINLDESTFPISFDKYFISAP